MTKRVDTGEWADWDWRSEGDIMVNGAFFIPSGGGAGRSYAKASSVEPKSSALIEQLTMNAGVLGGNRYSSLIIFVSVSTTTSSASQILNTLHA